MTSKQRAYLKSLAMKMDAIIQLGKGGLTPENTKAVDEALAARELIKISVLQNCLEDPKEMAQVLAERTHSQVVQVIGRRSYYTAKVKKRKRKLNCQNNRKKIGIMGGTFDPIHMGHLILGEQSYEQFQLDKVLFMPSGNPPHKRDRAGRASDNQRVDMVRIAIEDNPHFELSLAEMHETGYTYTYRTLEELKEYNPDTDYYFIIGADSLFAFDEWMEPERICRACTLVVAVRDHASYAELNREIQRLSARYNGNFALLDTMNIDVSSHQIRQWISEEKSLKYYVPDKVISYMKENGIYRKKEV